MVDTSLSARLAVLKPAHPNASVAAFYIWIIGGKCAPTELTALLRWLTGSPRLIPFTYTVKDSDVTYKQDYTHNSKHITHTERHLLLDVTSGNFYSCYTIERQLTRLSDSERAVLFDWLKRRLLT